MEGLLSGTGGTLRPRHVPSFTQVVDIFLIHRRRQYRRPEVGRDVERT